MPIEPSIRRRLARLIVYFALAALAGAAFGWTTWDLWLHFAEHKASTVPFGQMLVKLRFGAAAFGGLAVLAALAGLLVPALRRRIARDFEAFFAVRVFLYLQFVAPVLATVARTMGLYGDEPLLSKSLFFGVATTVMAAFVLVATAAPGIVRKPKSKPGVALDAALANFLVFLMLAEAALWTYAFYSKSELFWDETSVESTLRKMRKDAQGLYLGFPFNQQGYYDDDFFAAGPRDFVVALNADSFGMGGVPRPYNFTHVAESTLKKSLGERFERVAVHNFGIPGTGLPEYLYVLQNESKAYKPNLVVVCIFVGNDMDFLTAEATRHWSFQDWWIYKIPQRLLKAKRNVGLGELKTDQSSTPTRGFPLEVQDHILRFIVHPESEPARIEEEDFLWRETERVEVCNAKSRANRENQRIFFDLLTKYRQSAGENLLVVVIPDEFQVNDGLWKAVMGRVKSPLNYDRDLPQKAILAHCRQNGLACLDLLPVMRAAEPIEHTYHLRDTHFNAYGNKLAGVALADAILAKTGFGGNRTANVPKSLFGPESPRLTSP